MENYNHLNLVPGKKYKVIKEFTDFDRQLHPVGETWLFVGTNFLPYDDGLTLHVNKDGKNIAYRLRWLDSDQGYIIDNFKKLFVEPC
ncbi:MAG: DUF3601 domain-containing protein [Chitinophagaceae bacterium]|nr:DUF3601 domain-containing protein [Chitinophagaceae bacterium]